MEEATADEYNKYISLDLEKKLQPINQTIDDLTLRLEEFECMVSLVQEERCNAIGITGSLVEAMDYQKDLTELCERINSLEKLIDYIKNTVNSLETKIENAEEHLGIVDGTNRLKSFFLPLFKKNPEIKTNESPIDIDEFSTQKYFTDDTES